MNGGKSEIKVTFWKKNGKKSLIKKNSKIQSYISNDYINSDLEKLKYLIEKEKTKYFDTKPSQATRQCSMSSIESISSILPQLIGGSADLSGSNNTKTSNSKIINSKNFDSNYIHYGVRKRGMSAIMNGLALYGGLIPYGGTFLIFFLTIANHQLDYLH